MKIFNFSEKVGKHLSVFQSNFIMSKIVNYQGNIHIGAMHLQANGIIGYHEAVVSQLLLIVAEKGEFHETSTEHGLTAIVMEAENLEQAIVMPIIQGEL